MKLVNACLLGISCNYMGQGRPNAKLLEEFRKGGLYPVCPELLGGMGIPRPGSEIRGGTGLDVIGGRAKVCDENGGDLTRDYVEGAAATLRIAQAMGAKEAILKAKSPSCGCGKIYDGTFSRTLVDGDGVAAALLKKNGIDVKTEEGLV